MRRLHDVNAEVPACFRSADDVIYDDFGIPVTQSGIVMIFNPDDFIRAQGTDFLVCHFHSIDAQLYFAVARNLNGIVYWINLKTREHQLLQQINAVGRGLLLAFGRINNLPVYFAPLCRSGYRDVVESKGFFCQINLT